MLLKGQCHEIFDTFFGSKICTWALYEQAESVSHFLFVFAKLFAKNVCLCNQRLSSHLHCVSVVNDYVDTVSAFALEYHPKKLKSSQPFLPFHMGPRSNLLGK